jgi:hypothetical protein
MTRLHSARFMFSIRVSSKRWPIMSQRTKVKGSIAVMRMTTPIASVRALSTWPGGGLLHLGDLGPGLLCSAALLAARSSGTQGLDLPLRFSSYMLL